MIIRIAAVLLLCSLIVTGIASGSESNVCLASGAPLSIGAAQTNACFSPDSLTAAQTACNGLAVGQVCLGAGSVEVAPGSGLAVVGESIDLAGLDHISGSSGSLALIKTQADLPPDAQPIQMVLFGDASIANAYTPPQAPYPTITVINGPANILNLRATPSTDAAVVTTMKWGESLTADGRSGDGAWYRVQTDQGAAWVSASLVKVKAGDDPSTLDVLDGTISQPMQSVTLQSSGESCGGGLLIQAANQQPAHLEIDGALLTLSTATLLVQADQTLDVQVISGSADVLAGGQTVQAKAGNDAQMALSDSQAGAPQLEDSFAFASLVSAPLALLAQQSLSCLAGISSGSAALYRTPGGQAVATLDPSSHVTVSGQTSAEGITYYLVGSQWVAQNDVSTAGSCDAIPQVAQSAAQQASQPVTNAGQSLLPQGRSIWQTDTGPDTQTGTCISPPIAECNFLSAVTPQANGTITWLGQEPLPYTLHPTGANTFSFSGRNQLNNANLSLSVTFTSATTWVGSMKLVYDSDSRCTHTFNYTAGRIR